MNKNKRHRDESQESTGKREGKDRGPSPVSTNVADDISDFKKITVVGETMTRVQTISQFVNATDNLYDGFKAYDRLSDLGKGGKVLAEIAGKEDNKT